MASLIHNHIITEICFERMMRKEEEKKSYIKCDYDIFVLKKRQTNEEEEEGMEKSTG